MSTKTPKKTRKKLSAEERKQKMVQRLFSNKIKAIFNAIGFEYLPTKDIHRFFWNKKWELDFVFLFENVIIIFEDTTLNSSTSIKDHLSNKSKLFEEIENNKEAFIKWLKEAFADKFSKFPEYDNAHRYKLYYIYGSKYPTWLTEIDRALYSNVMVLEDEDISYFHKIASNIKFSARNEFFRYLKLRNADLWDPSGTSPKNDIKALIITPQESTKLKCSARIVSFMMSAETLMKNSYVLRKDNWEDSIGLYQRLIEKKRINSIREFLATKQETFLNNIIVSLPSNISLQDKDGNKIDIAKITDYQEHYTLVIPDEINSIWVIDGQHRIFAHFEWNDKYEKTIAPLRRRLHLLVTGLIFPVETSEIDRIRAESEIFLSINSNSKPVPQDVLLHIESLKDPFSPIGISRQILEQLNRGRVFNRLFELSLIKKAHIKRYLL